MGRDPPSSPSTAIRLALPSPSGPRQSRDSSLFVRWPHVVARRFATALVQAGSQIPATGMFGHLVHIATLPGPWWPPSGERCGRDLGGPSVRAASGGNYRESPVPVTRTDGALQLIGLHGLDAVARKREPLVIYVT